MLKFVVALLFIQVGVTSSFSLTEIKGRVRRQSVADKGDHYLICTQEPLELGIVLDSSISIKSKDFKTAIKFLQDFLRQYEISSDPNGVRVSIITYGKGVYPEIGFNLTTYETSDEVINAIGNIPHRLGLYTDTGKAIKFMHNYQLANDIVRPDVAKVSIVITDGDSQEGEVTRKAAEDARNNGIVMFAIGVGNVKTQELLNIAGDPSRVTKVDTYETLNTIKESLAYQTCFVERKTTTTPVPVPESCGVTDPADIFFVFSPANLGPESTAWAASLISLTLDTEDMGQGFKYGVICGTCPKDAGFDLSQSDTMDDIKKKIEDFDRSKVPELIQTLADDGFTEARGARPDSRKVAVIVVEGKTVGELQDQVAKVTDKGIQIFIADPSDKGVEVPGAVVLSGHSSKMQAEALVNHLCPKQP